MVNVKDHRGASGQIETFGKKWCLHQKKLAIEMLGC